LAAFLRRQRWFGGKARRLTSTRFVDWTTLRKGAHPSFLSIVEVSYADGGVERYLVPLALSSGAEAARVQHEHPRAMLALMTGARKGVLYDGLFDEGTCATLLARVQEGREVGTHHGSLQATNVALTPERAPADTLSPISHAAPDQ